eukprot:TRINITY_DN1666_c0_g1_i3.p1 TRINITY_DN1666_c0_g1~~TRINITY_DN1666_c0_g1_i3.p1  ORF type:complete len:247 (+),score=53.12 TRINITY_DN1666_c0_g1_i3:87-827(+)
MLGWFRDFSARINRSPWLRAFQLADARVQKQKEEDADSNYHLRDPFAIYQYESYVSRMHYKLFTHKRGYVYRKSYQNIKIRSMLKRGELELEYRDVPVPQHYHIPTGTLKAMQRSHRRTILKEENVVTHHQELYWQKRGNEVNRKWNSMREKLREVEMQKAEGHAANEDPTLGAPERMGLVEALTIFGFNTKEKPNVEALVEKYNRMFEINAAENGGSEYLQLKLANARRIIELALKDKKDWAEPQ